MRQDIEVSQGNLSLVHSSAAKLSVASDEYSKQNARLHTSKGLLRRIRWHERKEDVLLYTGLAFFALCVLYVVVRRSLLFVPSLAGARSALLWLGGALWRAGGGGDRQAASWAPRGVLDERIGVDDGAPPQAGLPPAGGGLRSADL